MKGCNIIIQADKRNKETTVDGVSNQQVGALNWIYFSISGMLKDWIIKSLQPHGIILSLFHNLMLASTSSCHKFFYASRTVAWAEQKKSCSFGGRRVWGWKMELLGKGFVGFNELLVELLSLPSPPQLLIYCSHSQATDYMGMLTWYQKESNCPSYSK